jgi:hypothetical protein
MSVRQRGDQADPLLARLRLADQLLWIVLAVMGAYVAFDLIIRQPKPPSLVLSQPSGAAPQPDGAAAPSENRLKPVTEYQETIAARNPFHLSATRDAGLVKVTARGKLLELTKPLVVVGINRGRIPEALIEDTTDNRTHFVKVGDQINGLTVRVIDARGIMVSYDGEETLLQ